MLTLQQRKKRQKYICSSDVSAILGCSPYADQYDTWLEKMYGTEELRPTAAMLLGKQMEPYLIDMASQMYNVPILADPSLEYIKGRHMSHPDGLSANGKITIEAKFSMSFTAKRSWRGDDAEGVPEFVWCQAAHQLYVCDAEEALVPALITALDPPVGVFRVKREEQAIKDMIEVLDSWWIRHVDSKLEPARVPCPSEDTVARVERIPEKTIALINGAYLSWVARWSKLNNRASRYKKAADRMKARLGALMKDAEAANLLDGTQLTYFKQYRKEYIVQAADYRVLRHKRG